MAAPSMRAMASGAGSSDFIRIAGDGATARLILEQIPVIEEGAG
jgi:hypothetical protein